MLKIFLAGRVGRDSELRTTQSGKSVLGFAVAVDQGWGDNKSTQWVECSLWGVRAEKLAQYITKGLNITISGRASIEQYTPQGGETRTKFKCDVDEVTLQGGGEKRQDIGQQQRGGYNQGNQQPGGGFGGGDDLDDEIPF